MRLRTQLGIVALVAISIALAKAWDAGLFDPPPPPLVESPQAVAAGRAVFAYRCSPCHHDIPLEKRVAGWSAERAYETIGRLPAVRPNMPPFAGTDRDRRALAVFLSALGGGRATPPE